MSEQCYWYWFINVDTRSQYPGTQDKPIATPFQSANVARCRYSNTFSETINMVEFREHATSLLTNKVNPKQSAA